MQEISNPFQAISETFFRPNGVFRKLATTDNWSWVPFFILMSMSLVPVYLYFQTIDFDWYRNFIADMQLGDVSPAEKEAFTERMTQGFVMWSTIVSVFLGVIILNAIYAGYLTFMARNDEKSVQGFTDWYGMTWWTALPSLLTSFAALLVLVMASTHEIDPASLSPLTFTWIFGLTPDSAFYNIGQFRLDMLWSIYLTAVAIGQWTSFSNKKAWLVAAAPVTIIYGIWLVFVLL